MSDILNIMSCGLAIPSPSSNNSSILSTLQARMQLIDDLQTELLPKIIDSKHNLLSLKDSKKAIDVFFSKHTTAKNYISKSFLQQIINSYQINLKKENNLKNYQDIVSYVMNIK